VHFATHRTFVLALQGEVRMNPAPAKVILSLSKDDFCGFRGRNRLKSPFDKLRVISS
jgi:hypothetical protein